VRAASSSMSSVSPLTPTAPITSPPNLQRDAAAEREAVGYAEERRPALSVDGVLENSGRALEADSGAGFQDRHLDAADLHAVHSVQHKQVASLVHDRHHEGVPVAAGFRVDGLQHRQGAFQRQPGLLDDKLLDRSG